MDDQVKKNETVNIAFPIEEEETISNETKISKTLSDLTTKRVISLIFSVMLCIPFFSRTTFMQDSTSYDVGLQYLTIAYTNTTTTYSNLSSVYLANFNAYHVAGVGNDANRYPIMIIQIL